LNSTARRSNTRLFWRRGYAALVRTQHTSLPPLITLQPLPLLPSRLSSSPLLLILMWGSMNPPSAWSYLPSKKADKCPYWWFLWHSSWTIKMCYQSWVVDMAVHWVVRTWTTWRTTAAFEPPRWSLVRKMTAQVQGAEGWQMCDGLMTAERSRCCCGCVWPCRRRIGRTSKPDAHTVTAHGLTMSVIRVRHQFSLVS